MAVAAPVRRDGGTVVAALSVSGPAHRLTPARLPARGGPVRGTGRARCPAFSATDQEPPHAAGRASTEKVPLDNGGATPAALRRRPLVGNGLSRARADQRRAGHGAGPRDAAVRGADPVAGGGRRPVRARRLLRPRDADRGARRWQARSTSCARCWPRPARSSIGTVVMGTVKGDVHDIGKNLVNIMFEGAGFHVIDLGRAGRPGEVRRRGARAPARHRRLLGLPHHRPCRCSRRTSTRCRSRACATR